jgi:hypothetical protein
VRQGNAHLHARVNGNLTLRFTARGLTSFSGLELVRRFLRGLEFSARLRRHLQAVDPAGDYSSVAIVRLIVAMLIVGARRVKHVRHLAGDPVVARFCGLHVLPVDRTASRWLSRCTGRVRRALLALNAELVALAVRPLKLRRLTVDADGTVICTGLQVERAFRGFNPHPRKDHSYYPITAHLAQTGHLLRVQNRSGNVHDGKAGLPFLRDLFAQLGESMGWVPIEIRLDGAFFRREILSWLDSRAAFAIKVPFYQWIGLQDLIARQRRWKRVAPGIEGFDTRVWLEPWLRKPRVALFRKRGHHPSPKNYQLDLFDPDDGHWEYSAVVTNHRLGLTALWHFMAGRGAHEKVLAELKHGYAFDTIPGRSYAANSTWQILAVLAHNLMTSFQLATEARPRRASLKRTALFVLKSIHTLRYELIARAGLLRRPAGRATLTLAHNLPTRSLFERIANRLAPA